MDHSQIEENNLIDRYVRGTMPVDLRTAFEEHFLDCPDCLEQLRLASSLRDGLRLCAAEMATAGVNHGRIDSRTRWRDWFAWRWAPLVAAGCLVVAAMPSLVLYRQLGSVRKELNRDQVALGAARQMIESVEGATPPVYVLNPVRGQTEPPSIRISSAPGFMVLTLESDFTRFESYRATLRDERNQIIWHNDQIRPSSPDAIGIVLSSSALKAPGTYSVVLEGVTGPGRYLPAATFQFSVSRSQ
jgi:hypothetical protein